MRVGLMGGRRMKALADEVVTLLRNAKSTCPDGMGSWQGKGKIGVRGG